jgi:GTP-binding protein
MKLCVAIIGKPNVGKSTLFNKLCGKRLAITDDRPGVTRDCKIHDAQLLDLEFRLVDTAGLDQTKDELISKMYEKTMSAAAAADVVLFMVDARHGITSEDKEFAARARKLDKKIILLANKSEGKKSVEYKDLYSLGFGEAVYISAEHKQGFQDLYEALKNCEKGLQVLPEDDEFKPGQPLRLAIVGRPNVGKSTIFNCILGYNRSIVSEVSGTTRDAINEFIEVDGKRIELIDTAGMRKKANILDRVESLSVVESINAIRRSHVVALVIDAQFPLEKQDLAIARLAIEEGRAMVLVVNKRDLITDRKAYREELDYLIEKSLFEVKGIEVVYVSAKENQNIDAIFKASFAAEEIWQKDLSTSKLNHWLKSATELHIPPLGNNGRRIRMKYVTQTAARPPTFTVFCNNTAGLPDSYTRYLYNSMREAFGLTGTPIRLRYKVGDNPFQQ